MKRFSIVTVALNEEESIRTTCESIRAQSCTDFEWIVIDGGSTDGTLDILGEYRDLITHLSSGPDKGIYDAMNKGIDRASGQYLVFMNAGDTFYNSESLARVAEAPEKDILYGDLLCRTADGETSIWRYPDDLPANYLLDHMLPHQASFFKRDLFDRFGKYDTSYRIAGDYELFVRFLYANGTSSWHVSHIISVFGFDGISSDKKYKRLRQVENHRVRKRYFSWRLYGLKRMENELKNRFFRWVERV